MLEVQTSPAQSRPLHDPAPVLSGVARFFCERAAALRRIAAAIAAGAAFAGCVVPPGSNADPAGLAGEDVAEGASALEEDCPSSRVCIEPPVYERVEPLSEPEIWEMPCSGVWITPPAACECPPAGDEGFTRECTASDCQEVELLLLWPCGDALHGTLRYSAERERLSAAGGDPAEGTWHHYDDGELRLEFEGNAIYTPTECEADLLQRKAHPPMSHPPLPLEEAIVWAWFTGDWASAPYFP